MMQEPEQPEQSTKQDTNKQTEEELSPRELRKQRKEALLDQIFGKDRPSMLSNIWGARFSLAGLVVLVVACVAAYIGTQKGLIKWDDPKDKNGISSPYDHIHRISKDTKKDSI